MTPRTAPESVHVDGRQRGRDTRNAALQVALDLFTERGYEATSMREIAERLHVSKAALYYHFRSKDEIVSELTSGRRQQLEELARWVSEQPRTADLLRRTALRWLDSASADRLQGMRFAHANPTTMQRLAEARGNLHSGFDAVIARFLDDDATMADELDVRMVFDALSTAMFAARATSASDQDVIAAARRAVLALTAG